MEVVAEALLSALFESLFKMLGSSELLKYARKKKIHAELKKWEKTLRRINGLLHDAEEKQLTNEEVKIWLAELQHLAYDIEDVLDEFATETLRRNVMKDSHASTDKSQKLIRLCTDKLQKLVSCCSFAFKRKMASGIEDITARLEDIAQQQPSLNLLMNATGTRSKQLKQRPPTTSLVDESYIYGRNDEKEDIVQKLLRDEGSHNPISVIPIVGMGGIGKTTLAQLVYNDSAIEDYFDKKVWVCVSENFDVVGLTRTILRKVAPKTPDLNNLDLDSLQETLKGELSQKKFLLILDDVWEEEYNLWEELRKPFISAASNSKIIVTTRKNNAAPITGDGHVHRVKELPDDECLFLLARHALAAHNFDARSDLKDIGLELVKMCNGLPLAAKFLGGLLRNKPSREEWERVLRNNLWNFPKTSNSFHPTLKLSYDDLPSHLKRCFVYCAIFPKDYEFDRDELVRLWMAEGFLHHPQGGKHMEDLGTEYFEDLVSRSFFQSTGNFRPFFQSKLFVMHDLISDLAQTIAEDLCYNYENKTEVDMSSSKYEKLRYASFSFGQDSQEYEVYSRMKKLRTIWGRGDPYRDRGVYGNKMFHELTHSKCVRVLSLPYSSITTLSNSIGDLIHLRYINFSGTKIQQLPESVSTLFNLQTLLLRCCYELEKLPDKIGDLANLLHLDIYYTLNLQKLPSSIGMLTNLQTLSKFIVKEGDGTTIAELKNLNNLRGSLSIEFKGLENVEDAKLANLKGKQGLEELELEWTTGHGRNGMSVLESLEPPHQNLKRLTISSYRGAEFPSWMSNTHLFSKLVSLNLRDYRELEVLPPLGQLCSLKKLRIAGLKAVKSIGVEFYGNAAVPFPSLERLEIDGMPEWSEWSHGNRGGDQGFPNLQVLRLSTCPKLIGSLPSGLHRLQHLSRLEITKCESLVSFPPMGLPCSLKHISVRSCSAFECFPTIDTRDGRESLLKELVISGCSSLKHFERNFKLPTSLRQLIIFKCDNLLSLPDGWMVQDDNTRQSESESHLEELKIMGCQGLTSFPAGKFPAALKIIYVSRCAFECFPIIDTRDGRESLLEVLEIEDCFSLKYFERNFMLPTSLWKLKITNCDNLLSLPDGLMAQDDNTNQSDQSQSHLKYLNINRCDRLTTLPSGKFPAALKTLEIGGPICMLLESAISENTSALETIIISHYDDIEAFPSTDCFPSLKCLRIKECQNLSLLPIRMQSYFPSLRNLTIRRCPNVGSLIEDGGLPRNLTDLTMELCENMRPPIPIAEWGMGMLSSLEILHVCGRCPATADVVSFPDDNCCWLPTSLKSLIISDFVSLESVSVGLRTLTSLNHLSIGGCPKLRSLPKDALPSSLEHVRIKGCPILSAHYWKNRGEYSSIKIFHA